MKKSFFLLIILFVVSLAMGEDPTIIDDNTEVKWGIINKEGKWIVPPEYEVVSSARVNFLVLQKEETSILFDKTGKVLLKGAVIVIRDNGYVLFCPQKTQCGYLNDKLEPLVPAEYDAISIVSAGRFIVKKNDEFFFFEKGVKGKKLDLPGVKYIEDFSEGLAVYKDGRKLNGFMGLRGFIDTAGKVIIPAQFASAYDFHNGKARAEWPGTLTTRDGKLWNETLNRPGGSICIDKNGLEVPDCDPFLNDDVHDGRKLRSVQVLGRKIYGYTDTQDKWVISATYSRAEPFSEGLAAVKKVFSFGYINTAGETVIEPTFTDAHRFSQGLAAVSTLPRTWVSNQAFGYIDKQGKWKIPPQFCAALPFNNQGMALAAILMKKSDKEQAPSK